MATQLEKVPRLAVLIDADNVSASVIAPLLAEIANFGSATVRRMYGDWTTPNLASWKAVIAEHSIVPIQQFRNTTGKNATDSAMIIDAMDLLHGERLDGFCLVSSDSDFTRLASRIREQGVPVYGFGRPDTPASFKSACMKFVSFDLLAASVSSETAKPPVPKSALRGDTGLVNLLRNAVNSVADDNGWAALQAIGTQISQQKSDFDTRMYGYSKLRQLVEAMELFESEERPGHQGHKHLWLRDKKRKIDAKVLTSDKTDAK